MSTALVVGLTDRISAAQADRLVTEIEERLPGVRVLVISQCSSLAVLQVGEVES